MDYPQYQPPEIRGRQPGEIIDLQPDLDPDEVLRLRYYLKTDRDLAETARRVALEETTGRWIGRQTSPRPTFHAAQAQVARIEEYGVGEGVIEIWCPLVNVAEEAGAYYQLMMLSVGGPILEFAFYEQVAFPWTGCCCPSMKIWMTKLSAPMLNCLMK